MSSEDHCLGPSAGGGCASHIPLPGAHPLLPEHAAVRLRRPRCLKARGPHAQAGLPRLRAGLGLPCWVGLGGRRGVWVPFQQRLHPTLPRFPPPAVGRAVRGLVVHLLFALIPCTHTPVEPSPCHVKPEAPSSTTHDSPWDIGGNWLREGRQLALGHTASKERGWEHRGAGVRRIKRGPRPDQGGRQ